VTFHDGDNTGPRQTVECPSDEPCVFPGCRPVRMPVLALSTFGSSGTASHVTLSAASFVDKMTLPHRNAMPPPGEHDVRITVEVKAAPVSLVSTGRTYSAVARSPSISGLSVETVSPRPVPGGLAASGVAVGHGLRVDFADGQTVAVGVYEFSVSQARCSTRLVRESHPSYEASECSGRGLCDTESGVCNCFDGFGGGACGQMIIEA